MEACRFHNRARRLQRVALKATGFDCGQVRGPVQLTFGRSIDPIVVEDHCITRIAVASQEEADEQKGDNRTMGRKYTVPYALYCMHGFVNPFLAAQTGFSEADLELFLEALKNGFELDRSAGRGLMSWQGLILFEHDSELGNRLRTSFSSQSKFPSALRYRAALPIKR